MNFPRIAKLCIGLAAFGSTANAAVSVDFNRAFEVGGGVSRNFADAAGTVSNDLIYGIIIDTSSGGVTPNGFASVYDSGFNLTQGSLIDLTIDGLISDDKLFISAGLNNGNDADENTFKTYDTVDLLEGDFTTTGGPGGISGLIDIPDSVAGLDFAVIWFDTAQSEAGGAIVNSGTQFGVLTDNSFVLPNTGGLTYDEPFVGDDPIRPADDGTFLMVPEPSTALLAFLGTLGLLRRRR